MGRWKGYIFIAPVKNTFTCVCVWACTSVCCVRLWVLVCVLFCLCCTLCHMCRMSYFGLWASWGWWCSRGTCCVRGCEYVGIIMLDRNSKLPILNCLPRKQFPYCILVIWHNFNLFFTLLNPLHIPEDFNRNVAEDKPLPTDSTWSVCASYWLTFLHWF